MSNNSNQVWAAPGRLYDLFIPPVPVIYYNQAITPNTLHVENVFDLTEALVINGYAGNEGTFVFVGLNVTTGSITCAGAAIADPSQNIISLPGATNATFSVDKPADFDSNNGAYSISADGTYKVNVNLLIARITGVGERHLYLRVTKNLTEVLCLAAGHIVDGSNAFVDLSASCIVDCEIDDTIEFSVAQIQAGGTLVEDMRLFIKSNIIKINPLV